MTPLKEKKNSEKGHFKQNNSILMHEGGTQNERTPSLQ